MLKEIIQEKYVVLLKGQTLIQILTMGGFKRAKDSCDLRNSQVRLFNSEAEARTYVEPRYRGGYEIVKVMVNIEFLDDEVEQYE